MGLATGIGAALGILAILEPSGEPPSHGAGEMPSALASDPDMERGRSALTGGRLEAALAAFAAAARRFPDRAEPLVEMAGVQSALGDRTGAIETLSAAAVRAPRDGAARFALGQALEGAGRVDEAEASYRAAAELAPRDPRPSFQLGRIAQTRGQGSVAADFYRRALAADPGFQPAAHYLAVELANASLYDEAVATIEAALALSPENASMRCNLGQILLKKGDAKRAAAELRRAIPRAPERAEAWFQLGRALEILGETREAEDAYRSALDWNPSLHTASYALAQIAAREGREAEAKAAFERFERTRDLRTTVTTLRQMVQKTPGDPRLRIEYGRALVESGDPEEAVRELEVALQNEPGHEEAARLLERAREAAAARKLRLREAR